MLKSKNTKKRIKPCFGKKEYTSMLKNLFYLVFPNLLQDIRGKSVSGPGPDHNHKMGFAPPCDIFEITYEDEDTSMQWN